MKNLQTRTTAEKGNSHKYNSDLKEAITFLGNPDTKIICRKIGDEIEIEITEGLSTLFLGSKDDFFKLLNKE